MKTLILFVTSKRTKLYAMILENSYKLTTEYLYSVGLQAKEIRLQNNIKKIQFL